MIRIGVTGTRRGASDQQLATFDQLLSSARAMNGEIQLHHGGCRGVDVEAAAIARASHRAVLFAHPASPGVYSGAVGEHVAAPLPPLERNRAIVDTVDMLIAMPLGDEVVRSGTWATVRYARQRRVPTIIIALDGSVRAG